MTDRGMGLIRELVDEAMPERASPDDRALLSLAIRELVSQCADATADPQAYGRNAVEIAISGGRLREILTTPSRTLRVTPRPPPPPPNGDVWRDRPG